MSKERYDQIIDEVYNNYCKSFENQTTIEQYSFDTDPMSQLMFISKIINDPEFSEKWGVTIYAEVEEDEVWMGIVYNGDTTKVKVK